MIASVPSRRRGQVLEVAGGADAHVRADAGERVAAIVGLAVSKRTPRGARARALEFSTVPCYRLYLTQFVATIAGRQSLDCAMARNAHD